MKPDLIADYQCYGGENPLWHSIEERLASLCQLHTDGRLLKLSKGRRTSNGLGFRPDHKKGIDSRDSQCDFIPHLLREVNRGNIRREKSSGGII